MRQMLMRLEPDSQTDPTLQVQSLQAPKSTFCSDPERLFAALVVNSWESVTLVDARGTVVYVRPTVRGILGYLPEEVLGSDVFALVHPEDVTQVRATFTEVAKEPRSTRSAEFRGRQREGGWRWLEAVATNLLEEPDVHAVVCNFRDITERKLAEESLRHERRLFRSLMEHTRDHIYFKDREGRFLYVNPAQVESLDVQSAQEVVGKTDADFLDAAFSVEARADEEAVMHTGQPLVEKTEHIFGRDGRETWVSATKMPLRDEAGEIIGTAGISRDITAAHRAEEELRASEERYRTVVEKSLQGILIHQDGAVVFANLALARMFGYERPEDLLGIPIEQMILPEDRELLRGRRAACLRGEDVQTYHEWRGVRQDGSRIWVQSTATLISWQGRPAVLSFRIDISERKRAEESLRHSEALYHSLVEHLPQYVFRKDRQGRFTFANERFCKLLGRSLGELIGTTDHDYFPAAQVEKYSQDDHHVITTGNTCSTVEEHTPPGGAAIHVEVVKTPLRDGHGEIIGVQGIFWDISERKRLEEDVRQAQKMEAIGRLAGGVAHDFNNLLMVITGYTELLQQQLKGSDPQLAFAREINTAATRAAELTRQLLAFGRKQILMPRQIEVNAVVSEAMRMLSRLIDENIEITMRLEACLPPIFVDPAQLTQVIVNLAVNARDAMPRGGRLTIATTRTTADTLAAELNTTVEPGSYVTLIVSDTGEGMTEEVKARIFEPFYTTKELGKGTGLGLAMAYGVIQQSSGHICVETRPNEGTTFRIHLPAVKGLGAVVAETGAAPQVFPGRETVLLAEDEAGVRDLLAETLRMRGYRVLTARHGPEALAVSEQHEGTIHLLITDVIMPGLNGPELAVRLRTQRPDVKILYISGHNDDAMLRSGIGTRSAVFLQKPFSANQLASKVRQILG